MRILWALFDVGDSLGLSKCSLEFLELCDRARSLSLVLFFKLSDPEDISESADETSGGNYPPDEARNALDIPLAYWLSRMSTLR